MCTEFTRWCIINTPLARAIVDGPLSPVSISENLPMH